MLEELADSDKSFLREVNMRLEAESERLNAAWLGVDVLFVAYLHHMSRFGFFSFGPISIDVNVVEEILEHTVVRRPEGAKGPIAVGDDLVRWSEKLMEEVRRSGRKRIDELHYLLTFMRMDEGLPKRVFGELGVSPEQVDEYVRTRGGAQPQGLEKLYSPEEVAEYLNVHVQTVRTWIRSGRLKARRLAGQRALRVAESDIHSVLEPVDVEGEQEE